MVRRCTNQKDKAYHYYGERGITVCDEWIENPQNFFNDMFPNYQEGLSIDRINNDLGYSKDNCRWTTQKIQSRNTRILKSTNTSGYRGASWNKNAKKWSVRVGVDNKNLFIGYFNTAIEAAKAYDKYVIDNNLEHTLNFGH